MDFECVVEVELKRTFEFDIDGVALYWAAYKLHVLLQLALVENDRTGLLVAVDGAKI